MEEETRRHGLKVLRPLTMVAGGTIMLVGLVADWIGLGMPGSFGKGQIMAVSAGLGLLLIGLLGQRVAALYRGAAILLLNTLILFACLALVADWIGLSAPGSFGRDQILLVLAGLVALLIGLLRQRAVVVYRGTAILLLNTLVLFACLEFGAHFVLRLGDLSSSPAEPRMPEMAELPYYTSQDWAIEYWHELSVTGDKQYRPWVIWSRYPFEGTTININQDGIRETPGADCSTNSYKVFTFGGSTMWGAGAPDWGTIAAYLQAGLKSLRDEPVCVVNFGETSFVSTQSVIELLIQLQSGNVPDLVMFYDGVNDVYAAYQSGQAGVHHNLSQIAAKFEGSDAQERHPLVEWLKMSSSFSLLKRAVANIRTEEPEASERTYQTIGIDTDSLADSVAQIYLSNYKIVGALAQEYGFKYYFFWQPVISIGKKPLTEEEQNMRSIMDPALVNLLDAVYRDIELAAPEYENLYYIAHVFDEQDSQIYRDHCHVTPVGNQLIAQKMLREFPLR